MTGRRERRTLVRDYAGPPRRLHQNKSQSPVHDRSIGVPGVRGLMNIPEPRTNYRLGGPPGHVASSLRDLSQHPGRGPTPAQSSLDLHYRNPSQLIASESSIWGGAPSQPDPWHQTSTQGASIRPNLWYQFAAQAAASQPNPRQQPVTQGVFLYDAPQAAQRT